MGAGWKKGLGDCELVLPSVVRLGVPEPKVAPLLGVALAELKLLELPPLLVLLLLGGLPLPTSPFPLLFFLEL